MIQQVVGQRRGGAAVGAAGDVAPAIVAAAIDLGGLVGTGGATAIDAGQFVRLGVAVEIVLLATSSIEGSLPQLAQMGVDKGIIAAASTQTVGEGSCATGAWLTSFEEV